MIALRLQTGKLHQTSPASIQGPAKVVHADEADNEDEQQQTTRHTDTRKGKEREDEAMCLIKTP